MSDREFEYFKTQLTTALRETLVKELARGGYAIAESPAQDVLRLRVALGNVNVAAPETGGAKGMAVYKVVEMTLQAQALSTGLVYVARALSLCF